jgi:hypothetical protein
MGIFQTTVVNLPQRPSEVKKRIDELHQSFPNQKSRSKLNWQTWDRFSFQTNAYSPLIRYNGKIENINHIHTRLHLQPKLMKWRLFYASIMIFFFVGSLLLVSILMMGIHGWLGLLVMILSFGLSWGLYRNLIGRPKKQVRCFLNTFKSSDQ